MTESDSSNSAFLVQNKSTSRQQQKKKKEKEVIDAAALEQKIQQAAGLQPGHVIKALKSLTPENTSILCDYIIAEQSTINISEVTKTSKILHLAYLPKHCGNKSFREMTASDIQAYLDSGRKSEEEDPLHKWIGYYNSKVKEIRKFFKWLYQSEKPQEERELPAFLTHIRKLRRKEASIYTPFDLWTRDDIAIFLKYCPVKRDRCYVAMAAEDTGCRPHELLKLKIKDIMFKVSANGKNYAEIVVNSGKTGQRHLPLFSSLPYIKEWIADRPFGGNPDSYLFVSLADQNFGERLKTHGLSQKFWRYYRDIFFPKLLKSDQVPEEDKAKIRTLLQRKWNLYVMRHTALTRAARLLKDGATLREHAGWSLNSKMPMTYIHWFNNESGESLLQAWGVETKAKGEEEKLVPKVCPECMASNRPDALSCYNCKQVLTRESYLEAKNFEQTMKAQVSNLEKEIQEIRKAVGGIKTDAGGSSSSSGGDGSDE